MHIMTTLDPMSLQEATKTGPRLGEGDLEIYFVSKESLNAYQSLNIERPGVDLLHNLDNPTDECGTDWN